MKPIRGVDADASTARFLHDDGARVVARFSQGSVMNSRRELLKQGGLVALLVTCGALTMEQARAADVPGFDAKTLDDALKILGGKPVDSKDVTITSPDIAENGAVVPVAVTSNLPKTQEIYILVEKNPTTLAGIFEFTDAVETSVSTRIKMGQTSNVLAVAMLADGRVLYAQKEVKVTLGGCGG